MNTSEHVNIKIVSYEQHDDTFLLQWTRSVRFSVPATVLACMVGEWGEPDEFVGRVFAMKKPA